MKNYFIILSIMVLGILPSCYDGDYYLYEDRMVSDIKTLSPETSESRIKMIGEWGSLSNDYAYFQIGRDKDFNGNVDYEKSIYDHTCLLEKRELGGTYYYRACAIAGNDTVYASNVESFTVNNEIQLLEEVKMDVPFGYFTFISPIQSYDAGILIATDSDFKDAEYYRQNSVKFSSGMYEYSVSCDYLSPGTTYYVKAIASVLLGTVESNVITLTTEDNGIKSVGIFGNDIDGNPITDELIVVIQNLTTQEWSQPYHALYNESKKNYEIPDLDYTVEPGTWYAAYAVTAYGATWDESGYVVFGQGDYQYGAAQVPICWGISELDGSDPYIKMDLRPWTSQITVEYPSAWGQVDTQEYGLAISDKSKQLPGSAYDIKSRQSLQEYGTYFGKPSKEASLSADGTKYSFTFNIFPTQLSASTCSMILYLVNDKRDVPCPDLNIEMGKHYTITFESNDLDITDVTVKEWEATEGGSITINP